MLHTKVLLTPNKEIRHVHNSIQWHGINLSSWKIQIYTVQILDKDRLTLVCYNWHDQNLVNNNTYAIVELKCMLAASHAAPWWQTDRMADTKPLHYVFRYGCGQRDNTLQFTINNQLFVLQKCTAGKSATLWWMLPHHFHRYMVLHQYNINPPHFIRILPDLLIHRKKKPTITHVYN